MSKELSQSSGTNSEQYQAGRDVNVYKTEITDDKKINQLRYLAEEYKKELNSNQNPEFLGYIKKLEHYTNTIAGNLLSLEKKLEVGGYSNDLDWALELKEQYSKRLQEHKFFKSSQQIHAFILAKVIVLFRNHVLSVIRSGANKETVKQVIYTEVIKRIENEIGGQDNVLELYSDDINGMIYFLTGNCHIVWK